MLHDKAVQHRQFVLVRVESPAREESVGLDALHDTSRHVSHLERHVLSRANVLLRTSHQKWVRTMPCCYCYCFCVALDPHFDSGASIFTFSVAFSFLLLLLDRHRHRVRIGHRRASFASTENFRLLLLLLLLLLVTQQSHHLHVFYRLALGQRALLHASEVLELEDACVVAGQVLLWVPGRAAERLQGAVPSKPRARTDVVWGVDLVWKRRVPFLCLRALGLGGGERCSPQGQTIVNIIIPNRTSILVLLLFSSFSFFLFLFSFFVAHWDIDKISFFISKPICLVTRHLVFQFPEDNSR
mmetsp:Transcript_15064/g.25104  ORF Transcript_15064/g.25104 Transcript_15064/m.25104 type:complete len:299 (+) Transcript_15064:403-1299(+)